MYINITELDLLEDDDKRNERLFELQKVVEHESMHNLSRFLGIAHFPSNYSINIKFQHKI
jgi:hypothetical protein